MRLPSIPGFAMALLQKAECLLAGRKRTIDEMRQKGLKE
jgi:hypothetical protein